MNFREFADFDSHFTVFGAENTKNMNNSENFRK